MEAMSDEDEALDLLGYVPKTEPAEKEITWLELCKEEGRKLGVILDDAAADFLLWERTPFPMIKPDDLRLVIANEIEANWKHYKPKAETSPTAWDKLKDDESGGVDNGP